MPGNFHDIPPYVIAQWPEPQYEDPDVSRRWLPILSCTLLGASTILVAARLYLRIRKQAGVLGLDDLFIAVAWIASVGFSTAAVIDSEWYSLDVHTWDVPLDEYVGAALTGFIAQVLFQFSTCATKASVLLFYRRMAKDTYAKNWLYATWGALAFTAAYFVGVLVAYCLMCQPLEAYWLSYDQAYDKPYTCVNGNVLSPLIGVLSVVSDLYAVLLPCIWLHRYNVHMDRRQRISLDVIFALGTIVAGCGIARTYYLWEINHSYDTSWSGFDLFCWSLLECHLAIEFACIPSLRAFVRRFVGQSLTGSSPSTTQSSAATSIEKSAQNVSNVEGTQASTDPELGQCEKFVGQGVHEEPGRDTTSEHYETSSTRSRSSDEAPVIRTAEDYETYALEQLSRCRSTYSATEEGSSSNVSNTIQPNVHDERISSPHAGADPV